MNIKKIIQESLIREGKFQSLESTVTFNFDLYHDAGGHTQMRKWRHGSGEKIYDSDLYRLLDDAKKEIVYSIVDGDIRNGKRFIVSRDGGDYLNVVVKPEKIDTDEWNLVIITTMREPNFNVGRGQLQIFV